jgi:hypothetical protein
VIDRLIKLTNFGADREAAIALALELQPSGVIKHRETGDFTELFWTNDDLSQERFIEIKTKLESVGAKPHAVEYTYNLIIPPDQSQVRELKHVGLNENFSAGAVKLGEDALETWAPQAGVSEVYRFIWTREYSHFARVFRIWRGQNPEVVFKRSAYYEAVTVDGKTRRLGPDVPERHEQKTLNDEDWHNFQQLLTELKFWDYDAQWGSIEVIGSFLPLRLLEGWKNNAYRVLFESLCPEMDRVQKFLVELFGIDVVK